MNTGLPGTGIGGFFYLLCAFVMPFIELYQTFRGRSSWQRWRLVIRQLLIASGIMVSIEASGWLMQKAFQMHPQRLNAVLPGLPIHSSTFSNSIVVALPFFFSLVLLIMVFMSLSVMKVFIRPLKQNGKVLENSFANE